MGFFGIAMMVVISGAVGINQISAVVNSTETILSQNIPRKDVVGKAVAEMGQVISKSHEFVNQNSDLESYSSGIMTSLTDLKMYLTAVEFGTSSPEYEQLIKDGKVSIEKLKNSIPPSNGKNEEQNIPLEKEFAVFSDTAHRLLDVHKRHAELIFKHGDSIYDLKAFLYFISVRNARWESEVEDAVRFNADTIGNGQENYNDFNRWYSAYTNNNAQLAKLLKKYEKLDTKAHKTIAGYSSVKPEHRVAWLERVRTRHFSKIEKSLEKLIQYVEPYYNNTLAEETAILLEMEATSKTLGTLLTSLEKLTVTQVDQAFSDTQKTQSNANFSLIATIVVSVILAIILGFYITRDIAGPIGRLVAMIKKSQETGDFSLRLNAESKDEIGEITLAVNHLLASLQESFKEANRVSGAVAVGDFSQRISTPMKGELNTLKTSLNASVQSVDDTMQSLEEIMDALANGNLSARMGGELKGELPSKVNHSLASIEKTIQRIIEIMESGAKGDFSERVDLQASGDFARLITGVDNSMSELQLLINKLSNVLNAIADGDLTQSVEGSYENSYAELKQYTNSTISKLTDVMLEITENAGIVKEESEQILKGNEVLTLHSNEQSRSLESTATAMEEITTTIQHNDANIEKANQLAENAREQADEGGAVVSKAVTAMQGISESSKKISDIIGVIDDIAFQTNLLALNAAVEAARAGEQGRGFAVVATEVRTLAGRSSDAAKDIKALIDASVSEVKVGASLIGQSGDRLGEIVTSVNSVSDIIKEITLASKEQSNGIEQVNDAVSSIDKMTQQSATLVKESTQSSESMGAQALRLNNLIGFFKLDNAAEVQSYKKAG